MDKVEKILEERVIDQLETEKQLEVVKKELEAIPKFKEFIELQKTINEQASSMWKYIEEKMIENDIKQLKGDFGTITIAERQGWTFDENEVQNKFFKKVIDTKKVTDTYRLEGKAPKGCKPYTTKYLTKRLK